MEVSYCICGPRTLVSRPSEGSGGEGAVCLCVTEVCDIEENVWAPRLGLKGKIDATVEVKVHRGNPLGIIVQLMLGW